MGKTVKFDDDDDLDYATSRSNRDDRRANFRRRIEHDRRENTAVDMDTWTQNTVDLDYWRQ